MEVFKVFSYNKVKTLIQFVNFVYLLFNIEKCSFTMRVDILDKNEMLLAHIIPKGAFPDIVRVDPTPSPTEPISFLKRS